ncbi:hypothetical protein, partial [Arthrobacter sp. STN4]|uniref:hypothetical protein n=1 Tax=Arthrobacter sp. STN4 TaxID=2923276 RepID=UPI0035BF833E|nr:hypothetical protein [Arthrobacter sp. STN4]
MEAMAGTPGQPGSTQERSNADGHVRRLIALAAALARSATAAAPATPGPGPGPGPGPHAAAPLGLDVDALSDAQAVSWAQEL